MSPVTEGKLRLGGMALRNGLLVHGPTHWAAAVRDKQGEIQVASGRKPRVQGVDGVPGVRGVVRLGEAFAVIPLVKRAMPAAKLPFESPAVIGVAAAASLGGAQLRRRMRGVGRRGRRRARSRSRPPCSRCAAASWPSTTASSTRRSPPTSRPTTRPTRPTPTRSTTAAARTSSRRCWPPTSPARCCCGSVVERPGPLAGSAVALASTAAAVEVFAWCERNSETRTARAIRRPGFEIQRVVGTREPDERQLEVGRAALAEILRVERRQAPAAGWTLTSSSSAPGSRAWWRRRSWPTPAGA